MFVNLTCTLLQSMTIIMQRHVTLFHTFLGTIHERQSTTKVHVMQDKSPAEKLNKAENI